jgi:hypothetical protein
MGRQIAGLVHYLTNTCNEAISNSQFSDAVELIQNYFRKYKIFVCKDISNIAVDGVRYYGYFAFSCTTFRGCYFLWKQGAARTELDGVCFTNEAPKVLNALTDGGGLKFEVSCNVNGTPLVQILPMVKDVISGKLKADPKSITKWFEEHQLYESLQEPRYVMEAQDEFNEIKRRRSNIMTRLSDARRAGKDISRIQKEFDEVDAIYRKMKLSIDTNVKVEIEGDSNELQAAEEEFERRATPEERFNDMEQYIKMVLSGLQPSVLICGAPGLGKTYRVMQMVRSAGVNYKVIKGKETALAFYMDLFHYHHEGDVLVCDDADDVLTDETITNLIKAATDSSDERIVSYGTSKPPMMSEEEFMMLDPEDQDLCGAIEARGSIIHTYPKSFVTEGAMIIITNKNAGQIDTAVRNRGLLCDLQFTVEECLGLVRDIMPNIMPNKLSVDAKIKALDYLTTLAEKKANMDISIRSFCTVAKVYNIVDDDTQAERMIKEQMKLQSLRRGRKY